MANKPIGTDKCLNTFVPRKNVMLRSKKRKCATEGKVLETERKEGGKEGEGEEALDTK